MRFHPLRATVLAWLALLLAVFSLRAPSAQAAASKTSNDDLARYADQLFSQSYPAASSDSPQTCSTCPTSAS